MGEQLTIPMLGVEVGVEREFSDLTDDQLLRKIEIANHALIEISDNLSIPRGLNDGNIDELGTSYDGIYNEVLGMAQEADRRGIEHPISDIMEVA